MPDRLYQMGYAIVPGAKTKEELLAADLGGCDAIIIQSIIYPPDGSRSNCIISMDGRTGEDVSSLELFKSWVHLAHALMEAPDLSPEKRELCTIVFEAVKAAVLAARERRDG